MRATHSPSRSARSSGNEAGERRGDDDAGVREERAPAIERELRRDEVGLVLGDEPERGVRLERDAR